MKHPYDPLPKDTDTNLAFLVGALLNKDFNNRPSIFEFGKIPSVKKAILQFVKEHDCYDEVHRIFDLEEPTVDPTDDLTNNQIQKSNVSEEEEISNYVIEQFEEMAVLMRKNIKISDHKAGWFGKHQRCTEGFRILEWIIQHVENNRKKADAIFQKMLER